jgi:pyruvate,orthophosphate dikinase
MVAVAGARPAEAVLLTTGLAASPGTASGPIATDPEGAVAAAEAGEPAILVRAETSPDDVHGMARAVGILTSRGGLASHAAVVARGWGIPAVVGAADVEVGDGTVGIGGRTFRTGDVISIDGATGEVLEGAIAGATEVVPEVRTLLAWRDESAPEPQPQPQPPLSSEHGSAADAESLLVAIAIKGLATAEALADASAATPDVIAPVLAKLAADNLITTTAGAYRLAETGSARVAAVRAAEQAAWGIDRACAALDAFVAIDHRVKAAVTAWQVRDEAGTLNDHGDAAYDREVLDRLATVHADAMAWLDQRSAAPPRLATYGIRLSRALDAALGGDGRFVASPRVDSYHGIWFELHEDLIALAGRTRADEAAAGRA